MTPEERPRLPAPDVLFWVLRAHWGLGILLLAATTDVSPGALLLAVAALAAGTIADTRPGALPPLARLSAPLSIAAGLVAAVDLLRGSRDLLTAVALLVLGVQAALLIGDKRPREGWMLCAISFVEFLAAAATTEDVRFAIAAIVHLGLGAGAMWALATWEERAAGDACGRPVPPAEAARFILRATVLGVVFTAILFLVIPRLGLGQILRRPPRGAGLSGFAETISLREVTGIKRDRRVVARIEFPAPARGVNPLGMYLRGGTYGRFDGERWSAAGGFWRPVPRAGPYYLLPAVRPLGPLQVADVALEPSDRDVLFVYGTPLSIEGSVGDLLTDDRGGFEVPLAAGAGIRYLLHFALDTRPSGTARGLPDPSFLEIPPGMDDIRALARSVTEEARTDEEKVRRLLAFFRANFRYSLSDPAPGVRSFLFERRSGYCEHFATALCLLLRACGVPARVAAGYLGGEWNDGGKYLIVRQSDAHAWTEGWIGGRWVTLDATPSLGASSPFFARTGPVEMYLDGLRQRWNKYVVNYSLRMQAAGVYRGVSLARRLRGAAFGDAFGRTRSLRRAIPAAAAAGALLAGSLVALRRFRGSRRAETRASAAADRGLPRPYARLIALLSRKGYRTHAGDTTEEMVRRAVGKVPPLADGAERFLALYHRDRFGPSPLRPDEAREAARRADGLRKALSAGGAA